MNESKSLMLWKNDFQHERDWIALCKALDLPLDTVEIEMRGNVTVAKSHYTHQPHEKVLEKQALELQRENPELAQSVFSVIKKEQLREDVLPRCEELGFEFTDDEMEELLSHFDKALAQNADYHEVYLDVLYSTVYDFEKEQDKDVVVNVVPPSLDTLKREYEQFIMATKDIRTIEQAQEFQEKYHIPVEINGVSIEEFLEQLKIGPTPIQWIRYEYFDNLQYVYDRFDGKPMFDVYYGLYGDNVLVTDITIDSLTKENYEKWLLDDIKDLAERELDRTGSIGYTMPDGKHYIRINVEQEVDNYDYYQITPYRVIDDTLMIMDDVACARYGNFEELINGCKWCFEQFDNDKEVSFEEKLAGAIDRSEATKNSETLTREIEKE